MLVQKSAQAQSPKMELFHILQDAWNCLDMFILLIDLLRLKTYTGYQQRMLLAMTSFRGFRVMIRQPTIRDLMTALLKTIGPVSTVFLLGQSLAKPSDLSFVLCIVVKDESMIIRICKEFYGCNASVSKDKPLLI